MRDLGLSATIGALLGIAVNVWFAHLWGSTGTAAAIAIGQTVSFLIAALPRHPGPTHYRSRGSG